ncbi:MAG TPA: endolytic transglycosylase MltG [Gallionellaceae bacterium]
MMLIKRLFALLLLAAILSVAAIGYYAVHPQAVSPLPYDFYLKPGSSLTSAARQMQQAGVLGGERLFVILARAMGKATQIKPGNYQLEQSASPLQLLEMISKGRVTQSEITIIEGWSFKQFRAALNAAPAVLHDSATLTDAEILQRIGATEGKAEGLFFPDTYNFASGSSDLLILKRSYQTMKKRLQQSWDGRDKNLPFETPYQALILASIVEKETGKASDRTMIASVFINRLRKGMKLQTDPTVIYGMGEQFDGNIRRRDLSRDTEYNTYTREGLTPTPIALPGWDSIQAVMHPAVSEALYFVARGDGSSQFSNTLAEHNYAVNRYQK